MREKCKEKRYEKLCECARAIYSNGQSKNMKKKKERKDEITDVPQKRGVAART